MSERLRNGLAGVLLASACVLVVGWAAAHWVASVSRVFGPTGLLPVPMALVLVFAGLRLVRPASKPTPPHEGHGA
jgi:hypothetical protein